MIGTTGTLQRHPYRNWIIRGSAIFTIFFAPLQLIADAPLYFVTDLGPLGAENAYDINNEGQVVGNVSGSLVAYVFTDLNDNLIAEDGELIELGALEGNISRSTAYAISDTGYIAGWSRDTGSHNHAVVWPPLGGIENLGPFDGETSGAHYAYGVNSRGIVVGQTGEFAANVGIWIGGVLFEPWHPVGNGGFANDINDAGQVVGWRNYQGQSGRFAFVFQDGAATDLGQLGGAAQWAEATAISKLGHIVGWATATNGETHAFLRVPHGANSIAGTMIDLETLGGNYSAANDVNDRGQVVGVARNINGVDRPFLYSNGHLTDLATLVDSTTWNIQIPHAINNRGQIVAYGNRVGNSPSGLLLTPNDQDGDGLFDVWESPDGGIDADGDGEIDLNLFNLGARPDHKDLFIEVDAMVGRAPSNAAIASVITAFNLAPVENPDNVSGVKLHVLIDETDIPRVGWPALIDVNGDGAGEWPAMFDPTKDARFGTAAERADDNAEAILAAKRLAFRYCIFADTFGPNNTSGIAELPGNDFIVTLGGWTVPGGTPEQQAGTFMHELGHTLGLRHGGGDNINRKPNYKSVMSYTFQTPKQWNRGWNWSPDYSRHVLATLDELDLNEMAGIGGSAAIPVEIGPPPARVVRMAGAIDYNLDGDSIDEGVVQDINHIRGNASADQILEGFNDWPTLLYGLSGNGDWADGVHLSVVGLEEMTLEDQEESELSQFACDACDTNCDSQIDGTDITEFVMELLSPSGNICSACAGDLGGNGTVDQTDMLLFIDCILHQ